MLHLSALIYNSRVHETGVRSVKLCPSQAFMMAFNELSRNHLLSCSLTDCPNCSMPPRIYSGQYINKSVVHSSVFPFRIDSRWSKWLLLM